MEHGVWVEVKETGDQGGQEDVSVSVLLTNLKHVRGFLLCVLNMLNVS